MLGLYVYRYGMTPAHKKTRPHVLLHSCCAPCTIYPFDRLRSEGLAVTGFFYNPNIHPFSEFEKRLAAAGDFYRAADCELMVDAAYDVSAFIRAAFDTGVRRCETCWRMRLRAAAAAAKEIGADAVTTTLLYSIYQDHDAVAGIGREESRDAGVEFYYEDFRAGWHDGQRRARELSIYRQKYCGCIFSEEQRYKKKIAALREEKRRA
jgi:predicted adenine nucleotide alpha hydrolase (AANH) superfamily ATPase